MSNAVIHEQRETPIDLRALIFPFVVIAALVVFAMRLWYLQIVESEALVEKANRMRSTSIERLAPRGLILDRNGKLLAGVKSQLVISAVPALIRKNPGVLEQVAQILEVPAEDLQTELAQGNWRPTVPQPIYSKATILQASRVLEKPDLVGIEVSSQPVRTYTDTKSYSHVLGYVWTPNADDVERIREKGREPAKFVGKIGLERSHELDLMGKSGRDEVVIDRADKPLQVVRSVPPIPGRRMILGLDSDLQRHAYEQLAGREGSVVALDPRNFEVLCSVNFPTYDVAPFTRGITTREFKALNEDPLKPMINRAIYEATAPGSTFKMVTAIAAKEAGIDPNRYSAYCRGGIKIGNRFVKCLGNHGSIGFNRAMAKSCNAYFISLGMRAGEDNLREACHLLGLGERTGIDISGERAGVNPTRKWIERVSRDGKYVWYPGDTANFSIGQGYVAATPLQMATMVATIANGGTRYAPHMVRSFQKDGAVELYQPEVVERLKYDPAFWKGLRDSLAGVMSGGTASGAGAIPGLRWAGKTGSAERAGQRRTDSWFVGYAPAENPVIALCVRVSGAGHGSEAAVPIAREVVAKYLKLGKYALPQTQPPAAASAESSSRASPNRVVPRPSSPSASRPN